MATLGNLDLAVPPRGRQRKGLPVEESGARVLVVDDDQQVAALIRRVLTGCGYQVDAASSLAQARSLGPDRYDALVVDARLGAERGSDLIEELVARDPSAAARSLVVTGGVPPRLPELVACLAKPFRPADLIGAVRALLAASTPEHPAAAQAPALARSADRADSADLTDLADPADLTDRADPARPRRLLGLARLLRDGERTAVADFVHDGPIQDLTAAVLELQLAGQQAGPDVTPSLAAVQDQLDSALRTLRWLAGSGAAQQGGGADLVRQRTAWLLPVPLAVDLTCDPAALDDDGALIADLVELALLATPEHGRSGPVGLLIEDGGSPGQIELTLTLPATMTDEAGPRPPARPRFRSWPRRSADPPARRPGRPASGSGSRCRHPVAA